jgi:hypothetical protein
MWKTVKWIIILAVVGGAGWAGYKWYKGSNTISGDALSYIPANAIYCITTSNPIETWKAVSSSAQWSHLQKNTYFASLTASANSLDSLIRDNDLLFSLIGSRSLIVSAHLTMPKEYDFLFLVDLQKTSGIKFLNEYLSDFTMEGTRIAKEKYNDEDLITIHNTTDNSNLYLSFPGNYLVASFNRNILISSLDAGSVKVTDPQLNFMQATALPDDGLMKLFLNYKMLPQFMQCFSDGSNEYINRLAQTLQNTALSVTLENELIKATGNTYINDSVESYIKTLALSGQGSTEFLEIAPQRTAFALGLGFRSFAEFFANFEKNIQQDVVEYKSYRENLKRAEDYLNINLQENFINWIDDEIAILELQSSGKGVDNETALIFKANNIEKARKDLAYIEKMVRRKTPVKFKTVDYRGYSINYLSMKGLFKVLLGKFFERYDKPYYTLINNFVIFSNHPQTLESIIDDYLDKTTLIKSEDFRNFRKTFNDESAVFVYLNTPVLFNSIKKLADRETKTSMESNKEYIVCFRQVGFQLVPDKKGFKTIMAENFVAPLQIPLQLAQTQIDSLANNPEPVQQPEASMDTDPMALPYIYAQNLNAHDYTEYFADSTIHFMVDLRNGFKDGSFTEYFENGEVKLKGHFKNDKRDGAWRLFDERGKLLMKRTYEENVIKKEKTKED